MRCVIGGEGRGGEGGEECSHFGCTLVCCVLFIGIYRGKVKVSFQISHLDSEAGVGPIFLCYCCTNVCSIFDNEWQHCCGYVHWCDGRGVERYAFWPSSAMCMVSIAHFTLESMT